MRLALDDAGAHAPEGEGGVADAYLIFFLQHSPLPDGQAFFVDEDAVGTAQVTNQILAGFDAHQFGVAPRDLRVVSQANLVAQVTPNLHPLCTQDDPLTGLLSAGEDQAIRPASAWQAKLRRLGLHEC